MEIQKFYNKWNGFPITDDGAYQSAAFKRFARDFERSLDMYLRAHYVLKVQNFNIGHYYVSGFVSENDQYVYFSFNVPRGELPVDLDAMGTNGILYRKASSLEDFAGETNHFTDWRHLPECIVFMLRAMP